MAAVLLLLLAQLLSSLTGAVPVGGLSAPEEAVPNDNRAASGRLKNGVFTLNLEAREVLWFPEGKAGFAGIPVAAFAEVGKRASIPGPMIRVPAGTEVHATVRNTLMKPLRFRGLQDYASGVLDTLIIAPGTTQEFRFRARAPGTYAYWARTGPTPRRLEPGNTSDAALLGAFVVDSTGAKPRKGERVFVITVWADSLAAMGVKPPRADSVLRRELIARERWFVPAVNGRSWPYTERLNYVAGDTIHWRVINGGSPPHPMHLHGFYFNVDARGNTERDTIYTPAQRRQAVTEWMTGGTTMAMTWVPTRPGNWLFHCHLVTHIDGSLRLSPTVQHSPGAHSNHAEDAMAGLVLGVHVAPTKRLAFASDPRPRRKLRVFVTQKPNVFGDRPGLSYILQEGPTPPAADSLRVPSSTLVLHENEPTEITVINRSREMASIHWHGIELESFYDGIGDWSGWGKRRAPTIAPGDSFVVRLTPPRPGTFIYHSHTDEATQLPSGLYGTLLVLPRNTQPDTTERVFLIGIGGPLENGRPVVNGLEKPESVELRAGVPHRFRLINISPLESHTVQLVAGTAVQQWRALAKDGADLSPQQATLRSGSLALHPGETYDFEVLRARPETLTLRVNSPETIAFRMSARAPGIQPDAIARILAARILTDIPIVVR
jgi:FtsP/CotA-like multicopper oxidase with cupredoxin domain